MTTASSTLLGRPVWYELMTSDPAAAETFYKKVVGWTSAPFGGSPVTSCRKLGAGDSSPVDAGVQEAPI